MWGKVAVQDFGENQEQLSEAETARLQGRGVVVPVHGNSTPMSGFEEKRGGNWRLSQQEKNVVLYVLVVCIS